MSLVCFKEPKSAGWSEDIMHQFNYSIMEQLSLARKTFTHFRQRSLILHYLPIICLLRCSQTSPLKCLENQCLVQCSRWHFDKTCPPPPALNNLRKAWPFFSTSSRSSWTSRISTPPSATVSSPRKTFRRTPTWPSSAARSSPSPSGKRWTCTSLNTGGFLMTTR